MEIFIVIGLLIIIACSELYRTYLGMRTNTKKDHFLHKLRGTRSLIWDLQFKVFKTREIREEIRHEYDMMKARIEAFDKKLAEYPADGDQTEKARVEDQRTLALKDAERYLAQIQGLDVEVEGAKPSDAYPNGHDGIMQQIDSLRELEKMLQDWIKEL